MTDLSLSQKSQSILNIAIFFIISSLGIVSFLNVSFMQSCFSNTSYYLVLALVMIWLVSLIQFCQEAHFQPWSFFRSYGWGILFSIGLALLIFISVQPYFRLLADETNLLAIAKSMFSERHVHNVTEGKWYYFNFNPINVEVIPKRPLLFPFLTSILSTFIGFHAFNPFLLNFFLLAGLFFIIFFVFRRQMGPGWAYSALMLVAAQPVLSQAATSAGFDLLALFFIFLSVFSLDAFLKSPSLVRFQFLIFNLLMLANVRYETVIFLLVTLGFLFVFRRLKMEYLRNSFVVAIAPLFLLPYLWQRFLVKNPFEWLDATHRTPFAFSYLLENITNFFQALIHFQLVFPYATLINLVGVAALVFFLTLFLAKRWPRDKANKHLFIILAVSSLFMLLIILAYGEGNPIHPASSRFFALFAVLASLAVALFFWKINYLRKRPLVLLSISLAAFLLYHPVAIENRFQNALSLTREYRIAVNFLEKNEIANSLVISDRPGMYTARNWSAISFHTANRNKEDVLNQFVRHLFEKIFVIQEIEYATKLPTEKTALDPAYALETLTELQNTATSFIRISRVKPTS